MKRLTREEIADVMKRGTRAHGLLCTYISLPRSESAVSVVVSKKVAPTAVGRNRIKRRMRAAAQGTIPRRAIVVIAKDGAAQALVAELRQELMQRFPITV